MKKLIVNLSFLFSFILLTVFSFAQNSELLAVAEAPVFADVSSENVVVTNVDASIEEVRNKLSGNLEVPDYLEGVYNSNVKVIASFLLNKNGELENIHISKKSDKSFGKILKKELEKIDNITPIKENGIVVEKYINLPVVFEVL